MYETKQLSPKTWPDFERLFASGTGWAFCACMLYQRGCHLEKSKFPTREAARIQNQAEKRALVDAGRAHGILVYIEGQPIGWCQYGPAEELPLSGGGRRDRRVPPLSAGVRWRITCFVTAVRHRRRGVAGGGLPPAPYAGRRHGGGARWADPPAHP